MSAIHTEIDINAPSERVWAVLTDFEAYPQWNPLFPQMQGEPVVGGSLRFRIQPPDGRAMTMTSKVLAATPGRELRWRGTLPVPGLFTGEHSFLIEPRGEASSHLVHGERFSGILVPVFGRMLRKVARGFDEMNHALKARCESGT